MNNEPRYSSNPKVTRWHLEKLAYIYVRQSSPKQVERNRESQHYQYQLAQRAQHLGWSETRVRIIDSDLGVSAQGSQARDGFQELVTEVSLGRVGILFGYEVSRLARNNRDWYQLLDLAAVFGTLIADADGIYDPRHYNDRLLLGLKGTMSEAELHLLKMRLEAGRLSQVRRGVYRQPLPTGFVRLPDGTVVQDPDEQVRHTIALVFRQFAALGSCRQVLRYCKEAQLLLPRRHQVGRYAGELHWKHATDAALWSILHNPAYAGAFAYGRRQMNPALRQPHHPTTGHTHRPLTEWIHLQQDVYPAFITWEQYLRNQEKLRENSTLLVKRRDTRQGPVREGAAVLQGLVICDQCGAGLEVSYKRKTHRYQCTSQARRLLGKSCASFHGASLDEAVTTTFLAALEPAQLDALDDVLQAQQQEQEQRQKQWQDQLRRAEYEAHLARRQYDAVDPEHRLVAAELERRWEEKLATLQRSQEQQARAQAALLPPPLSAEQRAQLQNLSATLPVWWRSGQLSYQQKKELLRSLIKRIIVRRRATDHYEARIVWVSEHYTLVPIRPLILRDRDLSRYEELVLRVHELWQTGRWNDAEIAAQLSEEGFYSARSQGVSPKAVMKIRLRNKWYSTYHRSRNAMQVDGYLTTSGLARKLGMSRYQVYCRLQRGAFSSEQVKRQPNRQGWLIKDDPAVLQLFQRSACTI